MENNQINEKTEIVYVGYNEKGEIITVPYEVEGGARKLTVKYGIYSGHERKYCIYEVYKREVQQ